MESITRSSASMISMSWLIQALKIPIPRELNPSMNWQETILVLWEEEPQALSMVIPR